MACVQVQCFVPPCPQFCDGQIVTESPQTVDSQVWSTDLPLLPSTRVDPRLLSPLTTAPNTYRNPGSYSGGQYPSSREPDFRGEPTETLDYWRLVLLALGVVIGVVVIKRL